MWILDALKMKKNDNSLAIVQRENKVTFADLWYQSEVIAEWIEQNVCTRAPIVIYGNKNVDIVATMIAALKTGRAYVPIDVTFPKDRVQRIISITESELIFNFSDIGFEDEGRIRVVNQTQFKEIASNCLGVASNEEKWVSGDDTCYILFTSGSTGEPKGVQISKNNIMNFVDWFSPYALVKGEEALNQVSYSFDVSVIQLYIYLPMGKTLICVDKEMVGDLGLLFEQLKSSHLATWVSTPAFIEMCLVYDSFCHELLPCLEKIILAGEVLTKKLVQSIWNKFPGVEVINGYGPTEGTVLLSCCTITPEMMTDEQNGLPIGYMIQDADYRIDSTVTENNEYMDNTFKGKGELIVTSKSISKGYFKNPEATNLNFYREKNSSNYSYRTGDVVYERNHLLYYCGRKDFQIKLNGYRIELDDISENINKIEEVNNSIVLPVYKEGRVAYIAAFIVLKKDLGLTNTKTSIYIRKALAEFVPSYMVPKKIILLDKFPLNVNGKIDRKLLTETYL